MVNIVFTYIHPVAGIQSSGIFEISQTTDDPVCQEFLSILNLKKDKSNIWVKLLADDVKKILDLPKLKPPIRIDHQVLLGIREVF